MSRSNLIKTIKFLFIVIMTLVVWNLPADSFGIEGLTALQQRMIAIFLFGAVTWILEPVPAWVTSLLIMVLMLFTISDSSIGWLISDSDAFKVVPKVTKEFTSIDAAQFAADNKGYCLIAYTKILACFADPTVMLFLGGFVLALVASKSGVDINMARVMLKPFGTNCNVVLLGFMLVTAIFSMFISNTATAAMMLTFMGPVLKQMPEQEKGRAALALAIPIGANIGGIGTPIGTPPNGIALKEISGIGFLDWMMAMVPLMLIILFIAWIILRMLFKFSTKKIELKIEGGAEKGWKTNLIYIIMFATILLWCTEKLTGINSYVVAVFPIAAFAVTGIIKAKDLGQLDWAVLWMVAGGFALGVGMKETGLDKALVSAIPFDQWSAIIVLVGAGLVTWLLSTFISNSAAAALMVPLLATMAKGMGDQLSVIGGGTTLLVGIALSASFAMALPISTPPNAIAYSTGLVKTGQMAKVGIIVGCIALALGFAWIIFLAKNGLLG